jgi:hypothetical protein
MHLCIDVKLAIFISKCTYVYYILLFFLIERERESNFIVVAPHDDVRIFGYIYGVKKIDYFFLVVGGVVYLSIQEDVKVSIRFERSTQ